jgi:hypothetical protein
MADRAIAISHGGPSPGPKNPTKSRCGNISWNNFRAPDPEDHGLLAAEAGGAAADLFSKRTALLPPYTTGIVRIRSNPDIKLGRVNRRGGNGELQIEVAHRGAGTRQDAE